MDGFDSYNLLSLCVHYIAGCIFPVWIHQVMPVGFVRLVAISVTNFLIVSVLTYFIALDSSDRQKVSLFIKIR